MASPILLYFPDELLAAVDKLVEARRRESGDLRDLTKAERDAAGAILKKKGAEAAEKYVASLDRTKKRGKISRVGTITELIQLGLKHCK